MTAPTPSPPDLGDEEPIVIAPHVMRFLGEMAEYLNAMSEYDLRRLGGLLQLAYSPRVYRTQMKTLIRTRRNKLLAAGLKLGDVFIKLALVVVLVAGVLFGFTYGILGVRFPQIAPNLPDWMPVGIKSTLTGLNPLVFSRNPTVMALLTTASLLEEPCDPLLLYAQWTTETNVIDCRPYENQPGPNPCISSVRAKGTFQYMDGTWQKYGEPGWDKWTLLDAGRATCRMDRDLKLPEQPTREMFAMRFSGKDGAGPVWNGGDDGYQQGLQVWDIWHAPVFYAKKFQMRMPAEGLVVTQKFGEPYPESLRQSMPELIDPQTGKMRVHNDGVDLAKPNPDGSGGSIEFVANSPIDGIVTKAIDTPDRGTVVMIRSIVDPTMQVELWHLNSNYVGVFENEPIWVGHEVGLVSKVGISSAPHLHLRLTKNGIDVDPMMYMVTP